MPFSLQHRHAVLLADRTRDVRTMTTVVTEVLAANPETTPLDIQTALRAVAPGKRGWWPTAPPPVSSYAGLARCARSCSPDGRAKLGALSRIAPLDQRTALPDQCLHSAEADVRPPRRKAGVLRHAPHLDAAFAPAVSATDHRDVILCARPQAAMRIE